MRACPAASSAVRRPRAHAAALLGLWVGALACADPDTQRLKQTTQATYDQKTGRLKELTYDANRNGRIDTWTELDGSRPVRARIDRNEDGRPDRWEYYDDKGQLTKAGFSRADDGRPDAWAYAGPGGDVERIEISSSHDENKIDRWEHYAPPATGQAGAGALVAAEEDSNGDGRPDKWETYESGALATVAFDENFDGRPDRRLTYSAGALTMIESEPNAAGGFDKQQPVKQEPPRP